MYSPDAYVTELLPRLFPGRGPARSVLAVGPTPPGALQWWALPSPGRVRLLVPVGGSGASVMLNRHDSGGRGRARALVARAVRSGLAPRLPVPRLHLDPATSSTAATSGGGGALEQLLREVVGEHAGIGLLLGPPRPNRKPVLQVFGPGGDVLAFVKVGTDPATVALVKQEATHLAQVSSAGLTLVEPPTVLASTAFAGLELLVLAPLVSSQRSGRDPRAAPPLAAMAEVAGSQGTSTSALQSSPFWRGVVDRVAALPAGPVKDELGGLVHAVQARYGARAVVMGSWHGDWAPWNMGREGDRVQVWDWERYSADVPWGLDLVHHLAQRVRHASAQVQQQEEALLADLPEALAASGEHGRAQDADLLLLSYLLTIGLRFTTAGAQDRSTAPHPRVRWALVLAGRRLDAGGAAG